MARCPILLAAVRSDHASTGACKGRVVDVPLSRYCEYFSMSARRNGRYLATEGFMGMKYRRWPASSAADRGGCGLQSLGTACSM